MSFNCVLVAVPGLTSADLATLGVSSGEGTTLDDATMPDAPSPAVFEVDGGTLIAGSDIEAVLEWLPTLTDWRTAVAIFGSTADTYSFEVYDGPSLIRQWVTVAGETVAEDGEPLLAEEAIEYLDDDSLLDLLEAASQLPISFDIEGNYVDLMP